MHGQHEAVNLEGHLRRVDSAPQVAFVDGLVGMGMGGEGSHAPGETADLKSFDRQAKRAALLMSRLAKEPRPKT